LKATEIIAGIGFPGAVQVLQLSRKTRRHRGDWLHTEVVYAVTSLSATPTPTRRGLAARALGHCTSILHYVSDVTFDEDRSQNLRLNDEHNIASARRHHVRDPQRPVKLLLTS